MIPAAMTALALACFSTLPAKAAPPLFSLDPLSPTIVVGGITAADLLTPGPLGGPPVVAIPAVTMGLLPGDDISAISYFSPTSGPIHFTVDRLAVGLPVGVPPDVSSEAASGQAAGDIFVQVLPLGVNTLATNQSALGLLPAVPPGPPVPPPIDHVDAIDLKAPAAPTPLGLVYTLAPGSPTLAANPGWSPADLLSSLPIGAGGWTPTLAAPAGQLGLLPGDVVDGLEFFIPGGLGPLVPLFSLAPGSPSLAIVGATAGDILVPAQPGGPIGIFMPHLALGLAPIDNLAGIAMVPEPGTWAQLGAGLALLVGWGRRRMSRSR
jgi:hypothetical protein